MKTIIRLKQCSLCVAMVATLAISVTPVRAAFVLNPSFESNWNPVWPHYSSIDGWTGGTGVNDRSIDRDGPFHDNGLTPDGNRVAFKQQAGDLSQEISGLTVGQLYWVQFYYNSRGDVVTGTLNITTRFGGTDIDTITGIQRVTAPERTNAITVPFHSRSVPFEPQADSGTLTFHVTNEGDRTALFDAVTIVPRTTNDVVIMNPSFEASGSVPSVGPITTHMAGWGGTGVFGVDTAGGTYADNGTVPDQDLVAFIEGAGSLTQTIANLVAGTQYQLSFAYNARSGNTPHLQVKSGATVLFETDVAAVGGSNPFRTNLTTFTVNSSVLVLSFEQTKAGTDALLIDDVRLLGQTGSALPPLQVSPLKAELAPGQSVTISVTVPAEKLALSAVDITLASSSTNIIRLAGAAPNDTVTLHYDKNGATTKTVDAVGVHKGPATVNVTESAGLVVPNGVLIYVVESFVRNPSFETEAAPGGVGVGPILAWTSTGTAGVNKIDQPFAANSGPIPDRVQVAFVQGIGSISQQITSLTPGARYWLQFRYSLRDNPDPAGPAADLIVKFGGKPVATIASIIPLSQAGLAAYYSTNFVLVPTNVTGTLEFVTSNLKGDATLLLDAINITRREAEDIVMQNPSFEASGAMGLYIEGPNTAPMSGWDITTGGHGTTSGGPFADNGIIPDQDQVLFLQGAGSASQVVSGFTSGQMYSLLYSVNSRSCCGGDLVTHYIVQVGSPGATLPVFEEDISRVGAGQPYLRRYVTFMADGPDQAVTFQHVPAGDRSLLLDNIRIVAGTVTTPRNLSITRLTDGTARITWPTPALGCVLQSAPTLSGPWTNDPALVTTQGSVNAAIVQPNLEVRFYRLSL